MKKNYSYKFLLVVITALIFNGCYVYNSLQSAKMLKSNEFEFTPGYSLLWFTEDAERDLMTNNIGCQIGYGIIERFNIRIRYERLFWHEQEGEGHNFIALEPKVGIIKRIMACSAPIGFEFGENIDEEDSWQMHPTIHLTAPINNYIELNTSSRFLWYFKDDIDNLFAFNFGVGLSSNLERYAIRPEFGFLINPGDDGHFSSVSIGISTFFGK